MYVLYVFLHADLTKSYVIEITCNSHRGINGWRIIQLLWEVLMYTHGSYRHLCWRVKGEILKCAGVALEAGAKEGAGVNSLSFDLNENKIKFWSIHFMMTNALDW